MNTEPNWDSLYGLIILFLILAFFWLARKIATWHYSKDPEYLYGFRQKITHDGHTYKFNFIFLKYQYDCPNSDRTINLPEEVVQDTMPRNEYVAYKQYLFSRSEEAEDGNQMIDNI